MSEGTFDVLVGGALLGDYAPVRTIWVEDRLVMLAIEID